MDVKFLKIVVLAMDVDGEFQQQELDMLKHIIKTHPEFRGISDSDTIQAMGDLYNKISVGMERKHIVEKLTLELMIARNRWRLLWLAKYVPPIST